jgi:hypothetical protein
MFTHSGYRHRRNHDGGFDSICIHCFRTVASDHSEARLAERETQHRCRVEDLKNLRSRVEPIREHAMSSEVEEQEGT